MTNFLSSRMLSSDGLVYSFNPTTATIDGFSFTIPDSFKVYSYDVLKVDENTNLLVGSASSIDGDGSGIFYTSFGNDGFSSEVIEILNEYRYGNQTWPTVAKSDSEILVTWSDYGQKDGIVQFFDLSLGYIGQQTNIATYYYSAVSTEGGDTDFSLFQNSSNGTLYHQGISADGTSQAREEVKYTNTSELKYEVITATNGKTWVVDSNNQDVYLTQLINGSSTDSIRVNFNLDGTQYRPSIIEIGDENLLVTWSTSKDDIWDRSPDNNLSGRFFHQRVIH